MKHEDGRGKRQFSGSGLHGNVGYAGGVAGRGELVTGYTPGVAFPNGGSICRTMCEAARRVEIAALGRRMRGAVLDEVETAWNAREPHRAAEAMWLTLLALFYTGDLDSVTDYCEELSRDQEWTRSPLRRGLLLMMRARVGLETRAMGLAAEMFRSLLAEMGAGPLRTLAVAWLTEALVCVGEFDQAHEVLFANGLTGRLNSGPAERAHILAARGNLRLATGQFQLGVDDFMECGRLLKSLNVANPAVIPWRSRAALGALAVHHRDLARVLAEEELAAARRWGSPRSIGVALHALALARRDEASTAMLEEAVELLYLAQAGAALIQALYDLGALRIQQGNVTGGRTGLTAAAAVARGSGNAYWVARTDAALARSGDGHASQALTPQEARVANLARAGYSNRKIAETLFLAVRTVEFHLSSVYRKLGISGRAELSMALSLTVS
ncbi:response regulator transcription factor [Spongiactinospora sp. 9N601]|uniref:response regulator transcription factor n=1 Tax=Spongiactinospora sp. 9N601 TaxID=3375149 RepID=UPI00378E9CFE